ncbi:MAG: sigma-70 family RNA polymerase sigma factor [Oscillospiraceae bacterium]|nr:sigma-70 family RNA polymerase sigma factor [Oscillospiraceae bacterium]
MRRKQTVYSDAVLAFDPVFVKSCAESIQVAFGMADQNNNSARRKALTHMLHRAMRTELTPAQRSYCLAYYEEGMTMKEIAQRYGVDESTVSRTIRRGQRRLFKLLQIMAVHR